MTAGVVLECPGCRAPLPDRPDVAPTVERCDACGSRVRLATFPAFFRPPEESRTGTLSVESGEATCFHHEKKRAVASCEACGKFLCSLCDVEVAERHYCTQCFESGARQGRIAQFERARVRYDSIALMLVLVSLLFSFFILIPVPPLIAIIIAITKRNAPPSLVRRSRLRMNIALTLAILEFLGGCAFWIAVWAAP
jgi:hypothetical protein